MQYMGSKKRIAKYILPFLVDYSLDKDCYAELFVGGCNMMDKTGILGLPRIGNDYHPELIAMWRALQSGWVPPVEVNREHYNTIRYHREFFSEEEAGFIGFMCSFGARWFAPYASNKRGDNYAERGSRILVKQVEKLLDVHFLNESYLDVVLPPNSLIYCDPPYAGTTGYGKRFNSPRFFQWCRDKTYDGHRILISEYNAPADFTLLLEIPHYSTVSRNSNKAKTVEKLYTFDGVDPLL